MTDQDPTVAKRDEIVAAAVRNAEKGADFAFDPVKEPVKWKQAYCGRLAEIVEVLQEKSDDAWPGPAGEFEKAAQAAQKARPRSLYAT